VRTWFAVGYSSALRSGCEVRFISFVPEAKPHCQLVLLNPHTGNIVTRFANGKPSTEPFDDPGDIVVDGQLKADEFIPLNPVLAGRLAAIEAAQLVRESRLSALAAAIKDAEEAGQ
jgi:hypothetical protein